MKTGREPHDKRDTLRRTIRAADNFKNAIIFCNRKREVAQLHRSLVRHGFNAAALHGDLDQSARTAALDAFRSGEVKLLIASDVAARGLDIPDVSHVFNFDVPHHADDYVHRIGRTGRAGKTGTAITIVGPGDSKAVAEIEKLIGQSIPWAEALPVEESTGSAPSHADGHREPRRDERGGGRHKQRGNRGGHRGSPRVQHREVQEARPQEARAQEARPKARAQGSPLAPASRASSASPRRSPASKRLGTGRRRRGRANRPTRTAVICRRFYSARCAARPENTFPGGYLTRLLPIHEYRCGRLSFAAATI